MAPPTSTALPTLFGLVIALVIVVGHLWMFGGDASVFVRATPPFAQPDTAPPSLRILESAQTYDGQFFYRLAVDPWAAREVGVNLDHPSYRQQRILYPLIVYVVSLGQATGVPFALILVNVATLAVLGGLAGGWLCSLARQPGGALGCRCGPASPSAWRATCPRSCSRAAWSARCWRSSRAAGVWPR